MAGAEEQVRSAVTSHSHQITGTTVGEGQENWAECQQMSWPTVVLVRTLPSSRDSGCVCALPPSFFCVFFSHKYFMTCLFSCLHRSSHLLLQSVDADSHSPLIPAGAVATSVKRRTPSVLKTQLRGRSARWARHEGKPLFSRTPQIGFSFNTHTNHTAVQLCT